MAVVEQPGPPDVAARCGAGVAPHVGIAPTLRPALSPRAA
jgi:hypothetical protein